MQVWRICKSKYAASPFSGEGGIKVAGRWHNAGQLIVYTSATVSLAAWEIWAHAPERPLATYISISATIPDDLTVESVEEGILPFDWRSYAPYPPTLAKLGTDWLTKRPSSVLRVPSAVIRGEFNYLLNPVHPDFARIRLGHPEPFRFDPRIRLQETPK